ncbi:MAG TPA: helical backbone metal receptor [Candidatus Thermoplasmatota archaeon]|nr:helical backbone metal receptor [Candidatus Thermoplasmatota archaeon]
MRREHPRVVSLVPSWTETLFSFGLDSLVGVTRFCVHPKELVERVERVGGTKDPKVARIAEIAPDLVVCEKEENRREDVEAMRAAGLDVLVTEVKDLATARAESMRLAEAVGRAEAGAALVARLEAAEREARAGAPPEPLPVYAPIWRNPWMTPTRDTYAHHALEAAGARNVFADAPGRYPERSPREAVEAGARWALLPTEPYPFERFLADARAELAAAGLDPARVALLDGEALTWYGARGVEGLHEVARAVRAAADSARE